MLIKKVGKKISKALKNHESMEGDTLEEKDIMESNKDMIDETTSQTEEITNDDKQEQENKVGDNKTSKVDNTTDEIEKENESGNKFDDSITINEKPDIKEKEENTEKTS